MTTNWLPEWLALPRSERCEVNGFIADVWPIGKGEARFTVLDSDNIYRCGGKALSINSAKAAALSFIELSKA